MNLPPDGLTIEESAILHIGGLRFYRKQKTDCDRLVIALKFDLGWPISDVAYAMGRSDTTIRTIIKRIKKNTERNYNKI